MATIRTIRAARPTPHSTVAASNVNCCLLGTASYIDCVYRDWEEYRIGDGLNLYRFLNITVMKVNKQLHAPVILPKSMAVRMGGRLQIWYPRR